MEDNPVRTWGEVGHTEQGHREDERTESDGELVQCFPRKFNAMPTDLTHGYK